MNKALTKNKNIDTINCLKCKRKIIGVVIDKIFYNSIMGYCKKCNSTSSYNVRN